MGALLKVSSAAKEIYGCTEISDESWISYAHALMCISGADDGVSEAELNWLLEDFSELIDANENFIVAVKSFNYNNASLNDIINRIQFKDKIDYKRALLYDSIKMAYADNNYSEDEKQAVKKFAELLNIPEYMARTIEGLVNTEKSIEATRRSIFELDDKRISGITDSVRKTTKLVQHAYGLYETSDLIDLNYGYALMCIAGADGEVSEQEKEWYQSNFAQISQVPLHITEEVLSVDFAKLDLKEILDKLPHEMSLSFSKTLIYNSIKMARADGAYPQEEKNAVRQAAALMEVPSNIMNTLDYLIDAEEKVNQMRRTLFKID
ncbi:MAG: TerB family tellurite resistance protein [Bacteroidota bacterium]